MMAEDRTLYRYVTFSVDPAWRRLPDEERALHKKELAAVLRGNDGVAVHAYSTVGLRADAELLLWEVAESADALQEFQARVNATGLGRWLAPTHSYLAMTKPSRYLKGHTHEGQEHVQAPGPRGGAYLFVYPMDKKREWYRLPFDERRRIMGEHFKIGHRFPEVVIHTGYSFGIDDQEFVVAFEGPSLGMFLDLVEELRASESSAYTARDVPIFTGVRMDAEAALELLDGARA
jgi:chlorite dismutase